jgi:hypothetical protein
MSKGCFFWHVLEMDLISVEIISIAYLYDENHKSVYVILLVSLSLLSMDLN